MNNALTSVMSRLFTGQVSSGYNYLLHFPESIDYLMGTSAPNPRGLLPFEHFPLTTRLMSLANPAHGSSGVVGSMPTMYWGEAYANFGWAGVLFVPWFVGAVFMVCSWLVNRVAPHEIQAAARVWVSLQLSTFAISGFTWVFVPITLLAGFSTLFLHRLLPLVAYAASWPPKQKQNKREAQTIG